MVQHNNEHLTIAQLSAYIDQELPSAELARCNAHIQSCQQCHAMLTDLQLTTMLLRNIPQVEVPRSFTLPLNSTLLPETPDPAVLSSYRSGSQKRPFLQRSLRTLSALAAIVGLVFILIGAFTTFSHSHFTTAVSQSSSLPTLPSSQSPSHIHNTPSGTQATNAAGQSTAKAGTPRSSATPRLPNTSHQPPEPQTELPPVLDVSQPAGRLGIGLGLFILGLLGVILTRQRHDHT